MTAHSKITSGVSARRPVAGLPGNAPSITVAIPVFNGARYIESCISSILKQSFTDFELIVVDNASTDSTIAKVTAFVEQDSRVRLICNPVNVGAAENYNIGFRHARGKYVKWSACDDRISENFLQACFDVLEANDDVAVAFASTLGLDHQDQVIQYVGAHTPSIVSNDAAARFKQAIELAGTCFPIFGLFRRDQLAASMLHRPYYSSDRALLAEIALMGKFQLVEEAVFYNREHEERSINIEDKLERSFWQNGKSSRMASAEHINLARHLWQIACGHPKIAPAWRLAPILLKRSFSVVELRRYLIELLALVAPSSTRAARRIFISQFGLAKKG